MNEWPEMLWQDDALPDADPFADTTIDEADIRRALDAAGYRDSPATAQALQDCFLDYVAAGYWRNLSLDDALYAIEQGDIELDDMIIALKGG